MARRYAFTEIVCYPNTAQFDETLAFLDSNPHVAKLIKAVIFVTDSYENEQSKETMTLDEYKSEREGKTGEFWKLFLEAKKCERASRKKDELAAAVDMDAVLAEQYHNYLRNSTDHRNIKEQHLEDEFLQKLFKKLPELRSVALSYDGHFCPKTHPSESFMACHPDHVYFRTGMVLRERYIPARAWKTLLTSLAAARAPGG
jgi:hypothetical protein